MNLTGIVNNLAGSIVDLARSNPLIFLIALIILAFLIYRRPKFFLIIFLLCLLLIVVLYVVSDLSTSGTAKKDRLIEKSIPGDSCKTPRLWI